jgi:hypothetical protein
MKAIEVERDGDVPLGALHEELVQVLAVDELEGDVVGAVDPPEVEGLADVHVRELNGDLGLVDQHVDELLVLRVLRMDDLERQELFEAADAGGLRQVDLGHAAERDAFDELVRTELLTFLHSPERDSTGGGPGRQIQRLRDF